MAINISNLFRMVNELKNSYVAKFNGRSGNITLTKDDIDNVVKPNNVVIGDGVSKISVGNTPPSSPQVGDVWIDTSI